MRKNDAASVSGLPGRMVAIGGAVLLAALLTGLPAATRAAEPPSLNLPLDCQPGKSCWLVNYVDHDLGSGRRDYKCGDYTYNVPGKDGNRHRGIDIAIRDLAEMNKGVPVLAAAGGTVFRLRDGMQDINVKKIGVDKVKGKQCGNAVILKHAGGWQTQYCHMRRGSLAVKKGQPVAAGDKLGLVGLSGFTEYPHLHITVRKGGTVIDPFIGRNRHKGCGLGEKPLWSKQALALLSYPPSAVYTAGFAAHKPNGSDVRAGKLNGATLPAKAAALVLWADTYQPRTGDRLQFIITGPKGWKEFRHTVAIKKDRARMFRFAGRKSKGGPWPKGSYQGTVTLWRGEPPKPVSRLQKNIEIR